MRGLARRSRSAAEYERFLFYRGLGEARLPVRLESRGEGTLTLDRDPTVGAGVRHVFVLRVENGRASYRLSSRGSGPARRSPA